MERTLSRLVALDWRTVGLGLLVLVLFVPNLLLLNESFAAMRADDIWDWWLIEEAYDRIGTGTMFEWEGSGPSNAEYRYRYSPLLPHVMAPFLAWGIDVWRVLHAASLALLPLPLAGLFLISGPFWFDVAHGNFLTFVAVAGYLALTGNRWGMGAYFGLALLMPRPLMIPLAVWLIWKRPESRPIALAVVVVNAVFLALSGEGVAWLGALTQSGEMISTFYDWGPSRFIGAWWLLIGVPLGAWLTWKGRLGLAGLAVSPYVLPYYLLVLVWDWRHEGAA